MIMEPSDALEQPPNLSQRLADLARRLRQRRAREPEQQPQSPRWGAIRVTILDRYLLSGMVPPFLMGVSGFLVIMLSNTLYIYAEMIIKKNVPFDVVIRLLGYNLPAILVVTFPVAYLFATLLVLGRMGKDSEITAMRACGISLGRIMAPIMAGATLVSLGNYYMNETVVPAANRATVNLARTYWARQVVPPIEARKIVKIGERYFYVDQVDRDAGVLRGITLLDRTKPGLPRTITAQYCRVAGNVYELYNGTMQKYDDQGYLSYEAHFKRLEINIKLNEQVFQTNLSPQEQNSRQLREQIRSMGQQHMDTHNLELEYHTKFSLPLATFFTCLIAAPLALIFSRWGAFMGVALTIALVFVYYVVMSTSRSLGGNGLLNPALAAWAPNLVYTAVGLFLVWRMSRR
ncbi:MAG: LptF/LptG family permease [Chloroflexi bacterium]|nr:LptF/LptG family permease [Chloroflexota bacterium]